MKNTQQSGENNLANDGGHHSQYNGQYNNQHRGLHQFSCRNCGAAQAYQIGTQQLTCTSCGHSETIEDHGERIDEYPLAQALKQIRLKPLAPPQTTVTCERCGAQSEWDIYSLSDQCPYCHTPIAKLDTAQQRLQIEAIVPFSVDKSTAFKQWQQWLKKRWFAPNALKAMTGHHKQFEGLYVPHWTFDSLTYTDYRGLRGEHYTDYVTQTRVVNGKTETVKVAVTKTRWYPASGQVRILFDDVLVLASMRVPQTIVNQLGPWQLTQARPYTADYLAGMKADYYQLDLDEAFVVAQQKMTVDIEQAIYRDIGGDVQRILQKRTEYQNSTYKLILLPVWYSALEYKGKIYPMVINGQTAAVAGQYPKSMIKITAAVITAVVIAGGLAYAYYRYQGVIG